jgi:hypothetical protein
MIKDIDFRKTEGIAMAVAKDNEAGDEAVWKVYLLNLKDKPIESVIISSSGYGNKGNQEIKTSELRQFVEVINPQEYIDVEVLTDELIQINNQFWISYSFENFLYDRKYIFLAESLRPELFTDIPLLNTKGILIK